MDSHTIRHLRSEWQVIGTTPQSVAACHRLAQCEPVVADLEVDNLAELVAALSLSMGHLSRNEAAEVINHGPAVNDLRRSDESLHHQSDEGNDLGKDRFQSHSGAAVRRRRGTSVPK
jgi:hypothetical protein